MLRTACLALLLLACLPPGRPALAQTPVDVALVLAVDASGSITEGEFRLQKEGIAAALTDETVLRAITSGPLRRVALAYVEWGSPGSPATVVDWAIVEDRASAEAFAQLLLQAPRSPQSYNAIGDAIDHSAQLLRDCPCQPLHRIIDISGDNPDLRSLRPAPLARDAAVAEGMTINGLAILSNEGGGQSIGLAAYFEGSVIGGPGAFVVTAERRADFGEAMRRKLVLEIAGTSLSEDSEPLRSSRR